MKTKCVFRARWFPALVAVTVASPAAAQLLPPVPAERCGPVSAGVSSAADWLERAARAVMPSSTAGKVLRFRATTDLAAWEQSDRPYEPYLPQMTEKVHWFDPSSGVEGWSPVERPVPAGRLPGVLTIEYASFIARDTIAVARPAFHPFAGRERPLNPWAVLADWRRRHVTSPTARVVEQCESRGGRRVVLSDNGERLYLAEFDGTPVKLERIEPDLLWGPARVEYLWNTWWAIDGGGAFPLASFRLVEGVTQGRRNLNFNAATLISVDSAPRLAVPRADPMNLEHGLAFNFPPTDTVRIGRDAFLLKRLDYTQAMVLRRPSCLTTCPPTSSADWWRVAEWELPTRSRRRAALNSSTSARFVTRCA